VNIKDWIISSSKQLDDSGIATARLDALVLLEDDVNKDRAWILAHPEFELNKKTISRLSKKIARRVTHEPLAYIRGKSEFYGREFKVTPATLQPRPETETMVELLASNLGKELTDNGGVIVDIGTGSGCLAITAKLEFPKTTVYATEINNDALKIAKENAKKLKADVTFFLGNLLQPISALGPSPSALIILANLPYVPDSHTINKAAMQEPKVAIFGGTDGLYLYRELFKQMGDLKSKPKYIFTESLPFQHEKLSSIAKTCGYRQKNEKDFIQLFELKD
jgi:release factor glutamine methyltransferase